MFLENPHSYNYLPFYRDLGLFTPATGKPIFSRSEPFSQDFNNTMLCFSTFRGVHALKGIKGFLAVARNVYSNLRTETNWKIKPQCKNKKIIDETPVHSQSVDATEA